MSESRVFDVVVDATKIGVAVAVTIWLEPKISQLITNETLSAIFTVTATAIATALLIDLLVARPELSVTWFDESNAPVSISTLKWGPDVYNYYTIRVKVRCRSWIPRRIIKHQSPGLCVSIEVGQDKYLVPQIQNESGRVALVDEKVVMKLSQVSDSEFGEDAEVSFLVPADASPVEDTRKITTSATLQGRRWTALTKTSANVDTIQFRGREHGVRSN